MEKKHQIIIVDDDETLLDVIKTSLSMSGYECEAFSRGDAALAYLAGATATILLTDIVMQGMEGLELTRRVKRLRPEVCVLVMTGFVGEFSYDQAIEAGASDFIRKPFDIHELLVRIKHVMMQEKLREMSITDELTGLPNRRGFFAVAQQHLKFVSRTRGRVALLFADLDDFKTINDTLGHQQGDEALVAIAGIFRQTFRDSDLIARMSGDEFAILLIDTPEVNFSIIEQRLQKNIDDFNGRPNGLFKLSVSIGMTIFDPDQPDSVDELLKQADDRMYEQKQRKKEARRSKA